MSKFKSEVAPKGMLFRTREFINGGKYCSVLTVVNYPRSIFPGYLANIKSIEGVRIAIKHIPIPMSILQNMLNKEISELQARYETEKDQTMKEKYRQDQETIDSFVQMIVSTQAKTFDFQLHLLVTANSKEELENKKLQIKNRLDAIGMRAIPLMFEQEKALKSMLPFFPKQDIEDRVGIPLPTITIAGMYPFVFDSIKDEGLGTLMGVDSSGGVVLFNQFLYKEKKEHNRNNANMIILGTSGSGKSTAAKLMLRTHLRNGLKCVCIDPEGELEDMVKTLHGDFLDLGKGGDFGMINPLEVVADVDEEEIAQGLGYTVLTRTIQQVKAFMKYYSPEIEDDVLGMFSEVLQDTYKRFKIDFNSDFTKFKSEDYPTFDDVYQTVTGKLRSMTDATHERDVMERLELKLRPLVHELRYYFTGKTTLKINSDFIVFNIKELMNSDENIKNALFFNILKFAWGLCLDKDIDTVLMVDEAHVLLSNHNELGAEFLAQIQRRARKYNTGTIMITQQPTDFAAPNILIHGKAIFDNASYYLIMGLKKQAVEDLSLLIDLNENEKEAIKYYEQGEALFVCGNRRMDMSVILTDDELESFGSGGGH